jgi:hypothetical protein
LAVGVVLEISAAVIVVGILVVGIVRLLVRSDLDAAEEWKRLVPFLSLGCGVILICAGWYGSTGIAAVIEIIAGAAMAGNAVYLAIRNRRRRPPAEREAPARD